MPEPPMRTVPVLFLAAAALAFAASCGGAGAPGVDGGAVRLRLGYFPAITHAPAFVGLANGTFAGELGPGVRLETRVFNAGPAVIEALFAGEIDAAYVGPNPAINGYVRSEGEALRIVAGAASGGAALIVRPAANISQAADLAHKRVATPQLGNTQDVALRTYLAEHGLKPKERRGNVSVLPVANADALNLFRRGGIDAAWVPEPWASRLVIEAGGEVFLDERDLWPGGDFPTTLLVVRTAFLERQPGATEALVRAHVQATLFIEAWPEEAKAMTNAGIRDLTGAALAAAVIDAAWTKLRFTWDPIAASLRKSAADAYALGFVGGKKPNLDGIFALESLERVLGEMGRAAVPR